MKTRTGKLVKRNAVSQEKNGDGSAQGGKTEPLQSGQILCVF